MGARSSLEEPFARVGEYVLHVDEYATNCSLVESSLTVFCEEDNISEVIIQNVFHH